MAEVGIVALIGVWLVAEIIARAPELPWHD